MGATIPAGTAIAIWIFAETLISGDKQTATTTTRQTNDKTATANASEDLDRQDSDMSDKRLSDKITDKLKTMGIVGKTLTKTFVGDKTTNGQTRQTDIDAKQTDTKTTTAKQSIDRQQDNQTVDTTTTDAKTTTVRQQKLSLVKGGKTSNDTKEELARQMALEYYNQHGKFPSYRQLGRMVGISKDKAGGVIRQLKTKIS